RAPATGCAHPALRRVGDSLAPRSLSYACGPDEHAPLADPAGVGAASGPAGRHLALHHEAERALRALVAFGGRPFVRVEPARRGAAAHGAASRAARGGAGASIRGQLSTRA